MDSRYAIDIERPRDEVFAFLDDPDNLMELVPNLAEHGIIEEKAGKVGTTFWHVYEENGRRMKMTGSVTEHEVPTRMAVALTGPLFSMEVAYELEEISAGVTRVVQHSRARFKHVFKLMGLLFGKKMERDGQRVQDENWQRLKALIEARPSS